MNQSNVETAEQTRAEQLVKLGRNIVVGLRRQHLRCVQALQVAARGSGQIRPNRQEEQHLQSLLAEWVQWKRAAVAASVDPLATLGDDAIWANRLQVSEARVQTATCPPDCLQDIFVQTGRNLRQETQTESRKKREPRLTLGLNID